MTDASPQTISELTHALDVLRSENAEYEDKVRAYQDKIASNTRHIEAFEVVIARLTGMAPEPPVPVQHARPTFPNFAHSWAERQPRLPLSPRSNDWARKLKGLTQIEALFQIANQNDGVLRVVEAKNIFVESGLVKGKVRNVSGHIYHTLGRSDRFERVEPGVFRLRDTTLALAETDDASGDESEELVQ